MTPIFFHFQKNFTFTKHGTQIRYRMYLKHKTPKFNNDNCLAKHPMESMLTCGHVVDEDITGVGAGGQQWRIVRPVPHRHSRAHSIHTNGTDY